MQLCVDRSADRIIIIALRHVGVSGRATDLLQPVNDLLRDASHDLALGYSREGFPEVIEAVQARASLGHGSPYSINNECVAVIRRISPIPIGRLFPGVKTSRFFS
jgi:hypothetical protein